jgi:hypothetical protein
VVAVDWNAVLDELLGFVGHRISLTLSVDDQPLAATIYGMLKAGPEVENGDFYIYVDTGSGVHMRQQRFTNAEWVDGPLGREFAISFGAILLGVKKVPTSS